MVEFKVGSIHTLTIGIRLPVGNKADSEDHTILFWLMDFHGIKYDIMQDILELDGKEFHTLYHITKAKQDLKFTMKMPDKPGDYKLCTNVDSKNLDQDPGIQIRLVE
jgi:hypothetical protein